MFAFRLASGVFAYAHFIALHLGFGTLVRVFTSTDVEPRPVDEIGELKSPFNPVFVGLGGALKDGRWKRIGSLPVPEEPFPRFRWTFETKPGCYSDWRIWDGSDDWFVGALPVADRTLELKQVWGAEGLEDRIEGGPYYGDRMI